MQTAVKSLKTAEKPEYGFLVPYWIHRIVILLAGMARLSWRSSRLIESVDFSHLNKVRLESFSVVTFSGSHLQIFLHRLFVHLLKIHPAKLIEMPFI